MSRWEPNARGRLEQAAMELYAERGYEATTVSEIAERAGLTERTFFRYFADKREVLFSGAGDLQEFLVGKVKDAPGSVSPMDTIVFALVEAATTIFEERRQFARKRQAIIAANAELRERELIKLATLGSALTDALRQRGVADPEASFASEAGMAIFKIAFGRWTDGRVDQSLPEIIRESRDELAAVTSAGRPAGTESPMTR